MYWVYDIYIYIPSYAIDGFSVTVKHQWMVMKYVFINVNYSTVWCVFIFILNVCTNSSCTSALRSIFPFTRSWDFCFGPVILQSFQLFTCPSGHLCCPTSVLTCTLGSIRPSICNVFLRNALCRVWHATILNRYSLRCTDAWILISHSRHTDLCSWAEGSDDKTG
jgi:hypothetical protein